MKGSLYEGDAGSQTLAAQNIFGTPVDTLTAAEAANLAGNFQIIITADIVRVS